MAPSLTLKVTLGAATLLTLFLLFKLSQTPLRGPADLPRKTEALPSHQLTEPDESEHNARAASPLQSAQAAPPEAPERQRVQETTETDDAWDERELIAELREVRASQPELALELAREGKERFQESESVAELSWFEARALVDLARFEEAKDVGREMLDAYPESTFTADVRRHLFTHPFGESPRVR